MRYSKDSVLYGVEQTARHAPQRFYEALSANTDAAVIKGPLVETFVSNYREHPEALHRMLLFRRDQVVDANNRIRAALYGPSAALVEDGERLMVLRTSDYPYDCEDSVRYYSGENFIVTDAFEDEHLGIPCWGVRFKDRPGFVRVIFAVSESRMDLSKRGGAEYEAALRAAGEKGRTTKEWDDYKRLQGDFVSVSYLYATSVHRAQGQTTDFCYCDPAPLLAVGGLMGPALAYVALTRARKQLVVR